MNRRLLVTRPDTDRTTRYISAWAGKILEVAESKGDIVFDLSKERANKKEIESILLKKEPEILFLNGHGDKNCVTGQNNEVLIDAIHNAHLLKGKIIYALACKSGEGLGPASIVAGARSFIGYKEDFIFMISSERRTHPIEDKIAELFLEPSNQVMLSILKGQNTITAHQNSRKAFVRNIQKLMTSKTSIADTSALRYLYWNAMHQVCYGDAIAPDKI